MIRLESVRFAPGRPDRYPFSLPAFRGDFAFSFTRPVTVFIGENGCGKSTLLDFVGAKAGLVRIAAADALIEAKAAVFRDASRFVEAVFKPARPKGMHFSAADFATYLRGIGAEKDFAAAELERVRKDYEKRSEFARMMASAPAARTLSELGSMYAGDLATSSHGEAYLDFFASRLRPDTLVLLDEPETPLSFQNQLALLVLIDDAVADGCQFLIATHSPVLAGIPEADLVQFGPDGLSPVRFEDVASFGLLRRFLADRASFFRNLRAK